MRQLVAEIQIKNNLKRKIISLFIFLLLQNFTFGQINNDVKPVRDSVGFEGKGLGKDELKSCAEGEMLKFIYSSIKYPEQARKNKTEGRVITRFVIERDGSIGKIELLHDIGDGCGEEAIRVIHLMKDIGKWEIGKSRGRSPRVFYRLPIYFKL